MNKEEAKRYLFERIPALVQCHPSAKWARLEYGIDNAINISDHFEEPEGDNLAKMEIPRDENGDLALEAEFWDVEENKSIHKYNGILNERYLCNRMSWSYMDPIYPESKPKMVPWSNEELLGAKSKRNSSISLITGILFDSIIVGTDMYTKDEFFETCTQLNGDKFEKEAN